MAKTEPVVGGFGTVEPPKPSSKTTPDTIDAYRESRGWTAEHEAAYQNAERRRKSRKTPRSAPSPVPASAYSGTAQVTPGIHSPELMQQSGEHRRRDSGKPVGRQRTGKVTSFQKKSIPWWVWLITSPIWIPLGILALVVLFHLTPLFLLFGALSKDPETRDKAKGMMLFSMMTGHQQTARNTHHNPPSSPPIVPPQYLS